MTCNNNDYFIEPKIENSKDFFLQLGNEKIDRVRFLDTFALVCIKSMYPCIHCYDELFHIVSE